MITINGFKFAEKESEITDSLFETDGTVSGRARRFKRKIMFYDLQGNPFAVINQHNVIGTASKLDNGKIWYSYGTPYFVKDTSFSTTHDITRELSVGYDYNGLIFK